MPISTSKGRESAGRNPYLLTMEQTVIILVKAVISPYFQRRNVEDIEKTLYNQCIALLFSVDPDTPLKEAQNERIRSKPYTTQE
jgi:hypothetical protein